MGKINLICYLTCENLKPDDDIAHNGLPTSVDGSTQLDTCAKTVARLES